MTPLRERMIALMNVRNYSERTIEAYVYWVAQLAKFHHKSPDQLGEKELIEFQGWLRESKKTSWSGFNQAMSAMRFLYGQVLEREEVIPRLRFARRERKLPVVLSVAEVEAMAQEVRSLRDLVMLSILYSCGLRLKELLELRIEDIDSSRMTIHVRLGKGKKDRYVPLSTTLLDLLRRYCRGSQPRGYLFPSPRYQGRPIDEAGVQRLIPRLAKAAGITKRVTPRTLRHTYATHQIEQGVNLRYVQVILGHRSVTTTQRYTQVSNESIGSISNPLDRIKLPVTTKLR